MVTKLLEGWLRQYRTVGTFPCPKLTLHRRAGIQPVRDDLNYLRCPGTLRAHFPS